jgi:hypothetical protein
MFTKDVNREAVDGQAAIVSATHNPAVATAIDPDNDLARLPPAFALLPSVLVCSVNGKLTVCGSLLRSVAPDGDYTSEQSGAEGEDRACSVHPVRYRAKVHMAECIDEAVARKCALSPTRTRERWSRSQEAHLVSRRQDGRRRLQLGRRGAVGPRRFPVRVGAGCGGAFLVPPARLLAVARAGLARHPVMDRHQGQQ